MSRRKRRYTTPEKFSPISAEDELGQGISSAGSSIANAIVRQREEKALETEEAEKQAKERQQSMSLGKTLINLNKSNPESPYYRQLAEEFGLPLMAGEKTAEDVLKQSDYLKPPKEPEIPREALTPSEKFRQFELTQQYGVDPMTSQAGQTNLPYEVTRQGQLSTARREPQVPLDEEIRKTRALAEAGSQGRTQGTPVIPLDYQIDRAKKLAAAKETPEQLAIRQATLEAKRLQNQIKEATLLGGVKPAPTVMGKQVPFWGGKERNRNITAMASLLEGLDSKTGEKKLRDQVTKGRISQEEAADIYDRIYRPK